LGGDSFDKECWYMCFNVDKYNYFYVKNKNWGD